MPSSQGLELSPVYPQLVKACEYMRLAGWITLYAHVVRPNAYVRILGRGEKERKWKAAAAAAKSYRYNRDS